MQIMMQNNDQARPIKVEITISDEADIYEVMETLDGLLVAFGFHAETVERGHQYVVEQHEYKELRDEGQGTSQHIVS